MERIEDGGPAAMGAAERLRAHADLMRRSAQVLMQMHVADPSGGYADTAIQRELDADADDAGAAALDEVATLRAERDEMAATVKRIWAALGVTAYDNGPEISERVATLRARLTQMEAAIRVVHDELAARVDGGEVSLEGMLLDLEPFTPRRESSHA